MATDAYATRQEIVALGQACPLAAPDPACKRGIEFLKRQLGEKIMQTNRLFTIVYL